MSFEHPNRNNESMIDVERDIMGRPSERNTTNLDLRRMKMILDVMGHPGEDTQLGQRHRHQRHPGRGARRPG